MNIFQRIFSTDEFMPHGMCYEWKPGVIWLHVLSDGFISFAYLSIPLTLIYFVRNRKDLVFNWIFVCFAIFIIACGTTHIMEIVNIWFPCYWLSGAIKAVTAVASVVTAILLIRMVPFALALPSPEQLRRSNEALHIEISEKTKALSEIESLNQELESFSYTVSHDLRAPLRAMKGYATALQEDFSQILPEEAKNYTLRIERSAERLDRLITDLLTYTCIANAEKKTETVDLDRLIRDVILEYPDLDAQREYIFIQGKLPKVSGHSSGLAQVVANLIGNGIKFVKPGEIKNISIRAEITPETGVARVWFEDKGIGIAPVNQKRIFKIFEQINTPGLYGGTGIGLAIVKKNLEKMQGSVGVESEEGKGSRFWIELRLA